jgi:carboxymethylenebutenolidase
MPIYDPNRIEYGITSGHIQIVAEGGRQSPAYWAHPVTGRLFPAVALIHDWWGITPIIRRMAHLFAQSGYYVIVPDLFDGQSTQSPVEAMELVKHLGDGGYPRVDAALRVLEDHHNTNRDVAAVGIGMGGSLAYEAAIVRHDLEAAISFYGFPQRYLGRFHESVAPILALYGEEEPHITRPVIENLQRELAAASTSRKTAHEVVLLPGVGHDFFAENATEFTKQQGRAALTRAFAFLETCLRGPIRTPPR